MPNQERYVAPLLAPTGIAAQRLAAESDVPFIRFTGISFVSRRRPFVMPENSNVEIQRDKIVIVDEMSMATVPVIARLLALLGTIQGLCSQVICRSCLRLALAVYSMP